ncbi:MAG: trypsin-like peptidase domain-containing protein, partial [Clostridiales bacterium]|nr:trypsin-like peptidase domain-containing protein [Clostridiales bacterium]
MENQNTEQNEVKRRDSAVDPKERTFRHTLAVMSVVLFICVLFSCFQTIYIFKLNTGLEGVMSYTRIFKDNKKAEREGAIESIEGSAKSEPSELPEPWFSIEEASSVNKQRMTTVDIVKKVSPATVPISIIGVDDGKETKIGSGTGFIITDDGYIVTNQHVVVIADQSVSTYYVTVILPDEESPVRAEIVGSDVQTDIAVLKVTTDKKLPCVTMGDSDTLQAGELAIVIGNAMGRFDDSVTVGVISAPSREINRNGYFVDIIQTDAAINPGNSGGPLINSFGEVIGITNAKIVTSTSESLGFAIPVNSVKKIIESIINYG